MEQIFRHSNYASKLFGVKDFKPPQTRWDKDEKSLHLKINRFGHAMDPERGMLAYYGTICNTTTKMIFSATSSTWYNSVSRENEIRDYIQRIGLAKAFDFLFLLSLASGLFRYQEFADIVSNFAHTDNEFIKVDISDFVNKYFSSLGKSLKTIFHYSNQWLVENEEKKPKVLLFWNRVIDSFDFKNNLPVTPIEIKTTFEEDEVTYISIHNILRKNGYKLVATSYPGSQGDRAILPETDKGRNQKRMFIDIVAYLPEKHTNLQENKSSYSKKKTQEDIDKLSIFKSDETYEKAFEAFLQKYDNNSPRAIKIGVGFWANKNFKVQNIQELNLNNLDYFVYINSEQTRWKIFSTGKEQIFEVTEGDVELPIRHQITSKFDEIQDSLF